MRTSSWSRSTSLIDYRLSLAIAKREGARRKLWLLCSVVLNVALLLYFKYANFFVEQVDQLDRLPAEPCHRQARRCAPQALVAVQRGAQRRPAAVLQVCELLRGAGRPA